jgi:NlpC/P60 family putative phage cell wall peptidase
MTSPLAVDDQSASPEMVLAEARRWIGTPYRHQGTLCGVGADCLGLVRGIWRATVGPEPEPTPPYSADWAEAKGGDELLNAALRHFLPVQPVGPLPRGAVILFRWNGRAAAKHAGIVEDNDHFIHAYSGIGVVCSPLVPAWRRRIAGVFQFPARPGESFRQQV